LLRTTVDTVASADNLRAACITRDCTMRSYTEIVESDAGQNKTDREPDSRGDKPRERKVERPKPGPRKIPEVPGNLRKREEWFRKRSS
jgi:hypothetical protein